MKDQGGEPGVWNNHAHNLRCVYIDAEAPPHLPPGVAKTDRLVLCNRISLCCSHPLPLCQIILV